MGRDWQAFLGAIEKDPKKFAEAVIDHLNPPKYVIEQLRNWDYLCYFCWSPRVDCCFLCESSVCEEHAKTYVGEKTGLEWYVCPSCQKVHSEEEILMRIGADDEDENPNEEIRALALARECLDPGYTEEEGQK